MNLYVSSRSEEGYASARDNGLGSEIINYCYAKQMDDFDGLCAAVAERARGIRAFSLHGCYIDLTYISSDPLIMEVTEKRFLQSIRAASFHGANKIVFHSAYKTFFGTDKELAGRYKAESVKFWKRFKKNIPAGMTVFLENVEDADPELLKDIIDRINSPNIRACLDIGHANYSSSFPVEAWVDVLRDRIGHVHIHGNDGTGDRHWAVGEGNIPFKEVIETIMKYSGEDVPFVLECDVEKSLEWLRQNYFI